MFALPPAAPSAPTSAIQRPQPRTITGAAVSESVTVTALPSESRSHLLVPVEEWGWGELRDYVVTSREARFGAFPREARKEYGIFTRFSKEFGADAGRIAQYAFETCDGWWMNAPVTVQRFCKGSDKYFAIPILGRLNS
jgi:hypothetical protein